MTEAAGRLARIRARYSFAVDGCLCETHPCTGHQEDLAFLLDLAERQQAAIEAAARHVLAALHEGKPEEAAP